MPVVMGGRYYNPWNPDVASKGLLDVVEVGERPPCRICWDGSSLNMYARSDISVSLPLLVWHSSCATGRRGR